MGYINKDELSNELLEYMEGLGLTEEQVNQIIADALVDINEKNANQDEAIAATQTKTDNNLVTNDKTIVGAINELFQNANNGKELIANAIGEPVSKDDTFQAMSNDINGLLSTFKTNMMNNGIAVESGDRFKTLIDKIATMVEEGSNKGIQFAEGTITTDINHTFTGTTGNLNVKFDNPLEFTPTYIILCDVYLRHYAITTNIVTNLSNINASEVGTNTSIILTDLSSTGFNISYTGVDPYGGLNITCSFYNPKYIAIGVGEEDTALLDSLKSILAEEGVTTTEEDDMASLITKVDQEFEEKNNEMENNKQDLIDVLVNKGVDVTEEDDMASLITKVDGMESINTNKSQVLCYKVDDFLYNYELSNQGNDYFNVFVKDNFLYFIIQDSYQDTNSLKYTIKFIKYNTTTNTVVLEKTHQNLCEFEYSISHAYLGYDDIVIIAEFGIHSISLNDFSVSNILRDTNIKVGTSKSVRIGDVIYFTADGYNYDYAGYVYAYNVSSKKITGSVRFDRAANYDYDYQSKFLCPDLINGKIYFASTPYVNNFYQTDLQLTTINKVNCNNSDIRYKMSSIVFANENNIVFINENTMSAYPDMYKINVANILGGYVTEKFNCECYLTSTVRTYLNDYSYRNKEVPYIVYYDKYMFIKQRESFLRVDTLTGNAIQISVPLTFRVFNVKDVNTVECITRTGIYTYKIKEI